MPREAGAGSAPSYAKLKQVPAVDISALVPIGDWGQMLLRAQPDIAPAPFFEALHFQNLLVDAIHFLGAALPAREAVWWACICVRETLPGEVVPPLTTALEAAESWVYHPSEETRRAAGEAASATRLKSSAIWAARAAFWSGGSVTPPGAVALEPAPRQLPAAVAAAVISAAVKYQPERADERFHQFLVAGVDIANGGNGRPKRKEGG